MSPYAHVLAPGRIGDLEVANRIVMAPMATRMAHPDGSVSNREIGYYVARARGGAGLLMTGAMLAGTDVEAPRAAMLRIDDDRYVPGLTLLVQEVHHAGARIGAQLSPGLGRVSALVNGHVPVSASATPALADPAVTCRALTTDEVHLLVQRFGEAAARAAEAGFDLIDVHGHTGHLVDQFLTEKWNQRTDEYGGSLENRVRLAVELVEAARRAAPGLPVSFRLTTVHHVLGGRDLEESLEVARLLQAAGVDLMVVDEGAQEAADHVFPPYYLGDAPSLATAAAVRKVLGIPVMVVGNMTPELAEKAMADGEVDFVGMGRPLVADPDLPRKLRADRPGSIRPCIRCNALCLGNVAAGAALECSVNPQAGYEGSRLVARSNRAKRVVVVGGGPAGLEAARVAALRGHTVDLYEKAGRLGGVLWPASRPDFKRELRTTVAWWTSELARLGVTVHLNWEITAGSPALNQADEVIIATGALPRHPVTVAGLDRGNALDALDVHRGAMVGPHVLIAGGGLTGADLALELGLSGHRVTLVEQEDRIARDMVAANRLALLHRLSLLDVTVLTRHQVRVVEHDGVVADGPAGTVRLSADTVVTAFGMRPNATLTGAGRIEDPRVHVVGDAVEPATVGDAVHAAFRIAAAL